MFYYRSRWNPTAHMFSRDDRGERKLELQILDLNNQPFWGPGLQSGILGGRMGWGMTHLPGQFMKEGINSNYFLTIYHGSGTTLSI